MLICLIFLAKFLFGHFSHLLLNMSATLEAFMIKRDECLLHMQDRYFRTQTPSHLDKQVHIEALCNTIGTDIQ